MSAAPSIMGPASENLHTTGLPHRSKLEPIRIDFVDYERVLPLRGRWDPRWEVALRTWPFGSAGTLAAVAIVAETGDATLGDHLYLHRVRSLGTPGNAHSPCHLT